MRAWWNVFLGSVAFLATGCIDDFECGGTTSSPCTSSADERSSEELGAEFCTSIRNSACGTPELEAGCLADVEEHLADAARDSCESELHDYLRCVADSRIECSTLDSSPPITRALPADPRCSDLRIAFFECVYWVGPNCGLGQGDNAAGLTICSVTCDDFASHCEGSSPNSPIACTCSKGPNAGLTFEAEDCGNDLSYKTGHMCRY